MKLFVTNDCNMSCSYCMIKNTGQYMDFKTAKSGVDKLILQSWSDGLKKFLYFFWWEPLLHFSLIKEVVDYIESQKMYINFDVEYVLCTNLTILNQDIIDFLSRYNVFMSISIWWIWKTHDIHRTFPVVSNKSAFNITTHNISRLLPRLPKENIGVGLVVTKNLVGNMLKDFLYIVEKVGLNHINLEIIVDDVEWNTQQAQIFYKQYNLILKYLYRNISQWKFIYINNLNWDINNIFSGREKDVYKPLEFFVELHPDKNILLSWFFTHSDDMSSQVISSIDTFDPNIDYNIQWYFHNLKKIPKFKFEWDYHKIKEYQKHANVVLANLILKNATEKYFKEYIKEVARIYF